MNEGPLTRACKVLYFDMLNENVDLMNAEGTQWDEDLIYQIFTPSKPHLVLAVAFVSDDLRLLYGLAWSCREKSWSDNTLSHFSVKKLSDKVRIPGGSIIKQQLINHSAEGLNAIFERDSVQS
ncbi:monofunctional biosynthetic peptidoglycantransglycosylase [Striga asiatica]|uniref:Monofunctional biosynthetic peptidoglycantransglycosylase n=1 Tax=Striga asiatica TaxID=4170 RepID=A0A5A7PD83_STRAF|nr:monofunctional biosynthetic peptidoglycantransglycosylase [Striga asiatica]